MTECIFCKIVAGELPTTCLHDDEYIYAFRDINPQAPIHFLVIPKVHIDSAAAITSDNSVLAAKCFEVIAELARTEGLDDGFRVITNIGEDGGMTVKHLHFHVLGGQSLGEKLI